MCGSGWADFSEGVFCWGLSGRGLWGGVAFVRECESLHRILLASWQIFE